MSESRPIWDGAAPVRSVLAYLGTPLLGLVAAGLLARRRRGDERVRWSTVAVWLVVLIPLAARSVRLALYPGAISALPLGAATWLVIMHWGRGASVSHIAVRMCAVLAAVVGPTALAAVSGVGADDESVAPADWSTECDVDVVGAVITNELPGDGAVLAHLDLGPILHVMTGREVIATPHHRNIDGILAGYDIMRSSPGDARKLIEARGIDAIVLCPAIDRSYLAPVPDGSLYAVVVSDEPPVWLSEVDSGGDRARVWVVLP